MLTKDPSERPTAKAILSMPAVQVVNAGRNRSSVCACGFRSEVCFRSRSLQGKLHHLPALTESQSSRCFSTVSSYKLRGGGSSLRARAYNRPIFATKCCAPVIDYLLLTARLLGSVPPSHLRCCARSRSLITSRTSSSRRPGNVQLHTQY